MLYVALWGDEREPVFYWGCRTSDRSVQQHFREWEDPGRVSSALNRRESLKSHIFVCRPCWNVSPVELNRNRLGNIISEAIRRKIARGFFLAWMNYRGRIWEQNLLEPFESSDQRHPNHHHLVPMAWVSLRLTIMSHNLDVRMSSVISDQRTHSWIQRAIEIVQRAIDEDVKQNYEEASRQYQNSLDYFMLALKCTFVSSQP